MSDYSDDGDDDDNVEQDACTQHIHTHHTSHNPTLPLSLSQFLFWEVNTEHSTEFLPFCIILEAPKHQLPNDFSSSLPARTCPPSLAPFRLVLRTTDSGEPIPSGRRNAAETNRRFFFSHQNPHSAAIRPLPPPPPYYLPALICS